MNDVSRLHDEAMRLAETAFAAKVRGDEAPVGSLLREALELERRAAELMTAGINSEPSRSVLFRSAATLALRCGDYDEAERLIAAGLAGQPPEEIARELHAVMTAAQMARQRSVDR